MSEIKKLAKELQEYTKVVGSHNIHIQEIANELVEALDQPTLNENQQIVLDYMKRDYKEFNNQSPIEVPISLFENFENGCLDEDVFLAFESLNEKQEAEVIRAFMDWVIESKEE